MKDKHLKEFNTIILIKINVRQKSFFLFLKTVIVIQSGTPPNDFSDTHSPPLAYSITRYKVFSVSITSKSLTGVGERGTDSEFKGGRKKM